MDSRAEASAKECKNEIKATLENEGRWFPVDTSSASAEVVLPTPTAIDKAKLVDHIKQERQKTECR
jgi:hypothetical protein